MKEEYTKEKKIFSLLRDNARIRLKDIAKKLHLQLDIVEKTVKGNEKIIKHTTMLDFNKLGFPIRLFLALSVQSKHVEAIEDYLQKCPNVNSILKINNGYNFMCELFFTDIQESTRFVDSLVDRFHIFHKDEYYILKSITEQKFMTSPDLV